VILHDEAGFVSSSVEPRHVTNDAAASAEARKAAYAAEEEEEVLTPEEERRRHALFQEHLGEVLAEHDKAVPEEPGQDRRMGDLSKTEMASGSSCCRESPPAVSPPWACSCCPAGGRPSSPAGRLPTLLTVGPIGERQGSAS
jgi:hypothetical protein